MDIVVNEELKAYIDPLTPEEYESLERSILAEGCRDALVLWGDVLVDGHNRYGICQKHGLPFNTVQNTHFKSIEDVHLWMIDQHLGRRSVSDFQRGVLALRKREILTERRGRRGAAPVTPIDPDDLPWDDSVPGVPPSAEAPAAPAAVAVSAESQSLNTREALAKAARLSSSQVVMIEKIQKHAAPELVAAVRAGEITLSAAATVASLPAEEQAAAALGGRDELKLAAKRVRDAKRKPREDKPEGEEEASAEDVQALRQRVAELTEENESLRLQLDRARQALQASGQSLPE
ncbi:plasmid replication/partition related protein [Comamonadaceae bacterium PP-2]